MGVAQSWQHFLAHESNGAHHLLMLNTAEHHLVANVGRSHVREFFDIRMRIAEEQTNPERFIVWLMLLEGSVDLSHDHIVLVQASLGAALSSSIFQ